MKIILRKALSFSEIGRKDNQEDMVFPAPESVTPASSCFILCDGMGGHEGGEVASGTVSSALGTWLEQKIENCHDITKSDFENALAFAYDALNKVDNGAEKKMGTTMTCLSFGVNGVLAAHIGDSRIYHIRPSLYDSQKGRTGILYQSSDHSLVNDLIKAGELTEEEAAAFPHKNVITRAMQPNLEKPYRADIFLLTDVEPGDFFFMCCDGILEQLTNERLAEILSDNKTSDREKLSLIKEECYGKTKDNYTCWLIPVEDVSGASSKNTEDEIVADVDAEPEDECIIESEDECIEDSFEEVGDDVNVIIESPIKVNKRNKTATFVLSTIIVLLLISAGALFGLKKGTTTSPTQKDETETVLDNEKEKQPADSLSKPEVKDTVRTKQK